MCLWLGRFDFLDFFLDFFFFLDFRLDLLEELDELDELGEPEDDPESEVPDDDVLEPLDELLFEEWFEELSEDVLERFFFLDLLVLPGDLFPWLLALLDFPLWFEGPGVAPG
jgi:hypothetical protein